MGIHMRTYAIYTHIHFDSVWFGGYVQSLHVEKEGTCIETEREREREREREKKTRKKAGWVCECGLNTM